MCWAACKGDGCLLAGHTAGHAWPLCYVTYLTRSEIRGAVAVQGCEQGKERVFQLSQGCKQHHEPAVDTARDS